jgi:predicted phosphoadenosine phosphosulfate sulfurtransferase
VNINFEYDVFQGALARVRWLFDEFDEVVVNVSGGKDSSIVFELCMIVAKEKGRLPLKTLFVDQEAEWQSTIDQIEYHMTHPDVEPYWYQIPIKMSNSTSFTDHWLQAWDPEEEEKWMRPKHPVAIKENTYGEDRFKALFPAILKKDFAEKKTCHVAGIRVEESPGRRLGMQGHTYKGECWGKTLDKKLGHYNMYPIWNWGYRDVWKAIHDNNWRYNKIYDVQYQYGIHVLKMRVSNVHHETSVAALFYMQEAEPETWEKLTQRLDGIDTAGKAGMADYFPKQLPYMFLNWQEYRDHLLDNLVEEEFRPHFIKQFQRMKVYEDYDNRMYKKTMKVQINAILTNDWEGVKVNDALLKLEYKAVRTDLKARKLEDEKNAELQDQ